MENNIRTIFFDFDGVLGSGRFYTGKFKENNPEAYQWIQKNIFGNKEYVLKWMKGVIDYNQVNKYISDNINIDKTIIDKALIGTASGKLINKKVRAVAQDLKLKGYKLGIISDNMDVFTKFTVPEGKLNIIFDTIINSADYGLLKEDQNGKLFQMALEQIEEDDISRSLLIDDDDKTIKDFIKKGGNGYVYKNFLEFKNFINNSLKR